LGRFYGGLFVWRGGSLCACKEAGTPYWKAHVLPGVGYKKCDGKAAGRVGKAKGKKHREK